MRPSIGKSVAGAYQSRISDRLPSLSRSQLRLYPRHGIGKLGVAPLTSMFLYGETALGALTFRPQVSRSDGFMTRTGHGEWICVRWPIPRLRVIASWTKSRASGDPARARFRSLQDVVSQYPRGRVLVEPRELGQGGWSWFEIPSDEENHDNWSLIGYPRGCRGRQTPSFSYLLPPMPKRRLAAGWRVVATRTESGHGRQQRAFCRGARRMVATSPRDLNGSDGAQPVKADVSAENGQMSLNRAASSDGGGGSYLWSRPR